MKKKNIYLLPIVLTVFFAACAIVRTLIPMAVLPELDIPNVVLLSLAALLLEHYFAAESRNNIIVTLLLSALTFGLLSCVSGFPWLDCLKLAVVGGIVYTVTAWLFDEMMERLSTGPAAKEAPVFSALGLYLAAQCFSGMIL